MTEYSLGYLICQANTLLDLKNVKDSIRGILKHDDEEDILYLLKYLNSHMNSLLIDDVAEVRDIHKKVVDHLFKVTYHSNKAKAEIQKIEDKKTDHVIGLIKRGKEHWRNRFKKGSIYYKG
jgi:hypothetical protein